MAKLWLVLKKADKTWTKYFKSELELDRYKNKIKHIKEIIIIEDSRDILYN